MLAGIILAAGQSSRMGSPKALLPCGPGGETFVSHLIHAITTAGIQDALVVCRGGDAALEQEVLRWSPAARIVVNPHAERGQLSSLVAGLAVADRPGVRGVLVMPVDMPLVRPGTIAQVSAAFAADPASIVRATHGGRHGHPVIFPRRVFDELRHADETVGAKAVIHAHASEIVNVEVDDPGVLRDVDVPEDYRALFGPF
jgi:CTP:molybdopterin cytidylyltransferase MocA